MTVQPIIFPNKQICKESSLYYRQCGKAVLRDVEQKECMYFVKEAGVSFFSYFNSLSFGKWRKYTNVHKIGIKLCYHGAFAVTLLRGSQKGIEKLQTYNLPFAYQKEEIILAYPDNIKDGILSFQMKALQNDSVLYEGNYVAEAKERPIYLALNICTYRREEFLKTNVRRISEYLLQDKLSDKIDIFIVDNAGELNREEWSGDNIYLISNANVGGSGGFARGMIEIQKMQEKKGYTHLVNMDDDIVLDPRILLRTILFLSVLKEEYKDYFLGASMLRLDKVYTQEEAGGLNIHGMYKACKKGLDLRKRKMLIQNEKEEKTDYCAWWYSCMPLSVVKKIGLPLPLFLHCDDVEYGLRNGSRNIFLNGIAVWHQVFDNKRDSSVYYYDLRNRLICDAVGKFDMGKWRIQIRVVYSVLMSLFMYRYKDISIMEKAVNDYFKGPEWLMGCNPEKLHEQIRQMGYKMKNVAGFLDEQSVFYNTCSQSESCVLDSDDCNERKKEILKMMITLNHWLWPSEGKKIYPVRIGALPSELAGKRKVVLYNPEDNKGILVTKNWKEFFKSIRTIFRLCCKIQKEYNGMKKEYVRNYEKMISEEMWEKAFMCKHWV